MKNVVILGGGVAGCIFALKLSQLRNDVNIKIYEKSSKLASRILISGNGRCNIYNSHFINGFNDDKFYEIPQKIISDGSGIEVFEYMKKLFNTDFYLEDDRYYPFSNRSETIHNKLVSLIEKSKNISVVYNYNVKEISYRNNKLILNKTDEINCDKLVFNLGGMSYLYDKFNYTFLDTFNLKYTKFTPALCPLKLDVNYFKKYSGTRLYANVTLLYKNKPIYEENGEILIKDDGISGVCIFNCTAFITKCELNNYQLNIKFDGHHDVKLKLNSDNYKDNISVKFCDLIDSYCELNNIELNNALKNGLNFKIKDLYDFKNSQVSKGGICIDEVSLNNFELIKNKNVVFLGETLDISLPCGGYNLGLAIIEGYKGAKNFEL